MKRIGEMTRDDHRQGIMDAFARNVAQGMDMDTAMTKASDEWKAALEAQHAKELLGVKRFLGIKDN